MACLSQQHGRQTVEHKSDSELNCPNVLWKERKGDYAPISTMLADGETAPGTAHGNAAGLGHTFGVRSQSCGLAPFEYDPVNFLSL